MFEVEVPVVAHELADPEKGSGIAMICTFGDTTDVIWWRELGLPVRSIVGRDGRIVQNPPQGVTANGAWSEISGRSVSQAQTRMVEMLTESGDMVGEPKPITHPVKFWENGNRPLEIVTSWQWFIKYPPTDDLLARGRELRWFPDFMRVRYENWVNGLAGDWNITRQRFFGVPFPVWYPVLDDGSADRSRPILPGEDGLPVDPSTDTPDGLRRVAARQAGRLRRRPRRDGHVGDVVACRRTSSRAGSTTPISSSACSRWTCGRRPTRSSARGSSTASCAAQIMHGALPWRDAAISGLRARP